MPYWLGTQITKKPETFNTAVHGQTLATDYGSRTKAAALFRAGVTNVAFVQAGTNDLGASTTRANLYATDTAPYVTYLKGMGYKVVVCTILPRTGSTGWAGGMETERGNYNAPVTANSAGADYVLDLTLNPVMGGTAAPNDSTIYADHLHRLALGAGWQARRAAPTPARTPIIMRSSRRSASHPGDMWTKFPLAQPLHMLPQRRARGF
jgi:lysophospholipase L1-like esterase